MSSNSPTHYSTYFLTFMVLLAVLAFTYSLSLSTGLDESQGTSAGTGTKHSSFNSSISDTTVILIKDDKLVIDRTCLDYKGMEKDSIVIDFYLLDLDDEQSYPREISRDKIGEEIRFGDHTYQLVSANDELVRLELKDFISTP